jgi:hypothetical protein
MCVLAKEKVAGSNPVSRSNIRDQPIFGWFFLSTLKNSRKYVFPIQRRTPICYCLPILMGNKFICVSNRNTLPFSERRHSLFVSSPSRVFVCWTKSEDDILPCQLAAGHFVHGTNQRRHSPSRDQQLRVLSTGQAERRHSPLPTGSRPFCPVDKTNDDIVP